MRSDMASVVLDRNRFWAKSCGKTAKGCKGYQRRTGRLAREDAPKRESMRARKAWGRQDGNRGGIFSWNPLRRFLLARVGQLWSEVWAEICEVFPKRSAVRAELTWWVGLRNDYNLFGFREGMPVFGYHRSPHGLEYRDLFYVCPTTGRLQRVTG